MRLKRLILGAGLMSIGRALFLRLLLAEFESDVRKLNRGDYSSLLKLYDRDFVLHFNEGPHRWSGDWVGRVNMDLFLQNYVAARIQGQIRQIAVSGPLWAMTLWVRFDDHAYSPGGGERIYENWTVLVLRTRWGRVVEQHDFYADTAPIIALDQKLTELEIKPIAKLAPGESDLIPG